VSVRVGSQQAEQNVLLDTGSDLLWVQCARLHAVHPRQRGQEQEGRGGRGRGVEGGGVIKCPLTVAAAICFRPPPPSSLPLLPPPPQLMPSSLTVFSHTPSPAGPPSLRPRPVLSAAPRQLLRVPRLGQEHVLGAYRAGCSFRCGSIADSSGCLAGCRSDRGAQPSPHAFQGQYLLLWVLC